MRSISILIMLFMLANLGYGQERIVGGNTISITERPFQVSIQKREVSGQLPYQGGGSIISPHWILTAAHVVCFKGTNQKVACNQLNISVGSNEPDANLVSADQIIVHPEYDAAENKGNKNDIALIHLVSPLTFSSTCQPIVLSNIVGLTSGNAVVSGWGASSVGGYPINYLKATTVTLIPYTHSSVNYTNVGPWFLFAAASQTMTLGGDSGGPLTVTSSSYGRVLAGIVSYGALNSPQSHPSAYTNVGYYHNWIRQQTGIDLPAITGNSIVHTDGYYGFSGLYCPATNASWNISNSNIATVNSSGRVVRNGMASGLVTLTASINNFGTPISLSRDILIDLPPYKVDCVFSGQEVYRVGSTYPFYASPQWGGMVMSNIPLTYIWGYSSGPNGEGYVPVKTYNNTTFVDMQPTFTFNSSGTYRIEMRVQDDYGTSSANTKTITVIDSYFAVALNGSGSLLTISPCEESLQTLTAARSASPSYTAQLYNGASLVRSLPLPATGDTFVDVSSLAKGIYFLAILKDNAVLERHKVFIR